MNRTVRPVAPAVEDTPGTYEIALELAFEPPAVSGAGDAAGVLYQSAGPTGDDQIVHFGSTGDAPAAGWPPSPTGSMVELVVDPDPPNPGWTYSGIKVLGTGTVDVRTYISTSGVGYVTHTITVSIRLNGAIVASESHQTVHLGLGFYAGEETVTIEGLEVEPDDLITAHVTCEPMMPFFRTPSGSGQSGESLAITGGSLS